MNITREAEIHLNPVTSTADVNVGIQLTTDKYYWVLYKSTRGITREFVTTIHPFNIDRTFNGIQNLLNWKTITATEFTNFKCADEELLEKEVD